MEGNFIAAGMLLPMVFSVWVVVRAWSAITVGSFFKGLFWGFVLFFGVLILNMHFCLEGEPACQAYDLGVCLLCLLALARPCRLRKTAAALVTVSALYLGFLYTDLVHSDSYTGNPGYASHTFWHTPLTGLWARRPGAPGDLYRQTRAADTLPDSKRQEP